MAAVGIADALRRADGNITVLDDRVAVETDAVFVWLKGKSALTPRTDRLHQREGVECNRPGTGSE